MIALFYIVFWILDLSPEHLHYNWRCYLLYSTAFIINVHMLHFWGEWTKSRLGHQMAKCHHWKWIIFVALKMDEDEHELIKMSHLCCSRGHEEPCLLPEVRLYAGQQILHLHCLCQHLLPCETQVVHTLCLLLAQTQLVLHQQTKWLLEEVLHQAREIVHLFIDIFVYRYLDAYPQTTTSSLKKFSENIYKHLTTSSTLKIWLTYIFFCFLQERKQLNCVLKKPANCCSTKIREWYGKWPKERSVLGGEGSWYKRVTIKNK